MTDIETGLPPEPELKGPLKPVAETTPLERIMMGVAGAAVITSVAAIIVEGSTIVILAGLLSSVMGPYAYYQQTRLTDIKTLQETHEAVEAEVARLSESNDKLSKNIGDLSSTVDRLEEVETALDVISKQQGQSVSTFAKQVEKNRQILNDMHSNVKNTIVQNLISVVFASDTDQNDVVDEHEIDQMIYALQKVGGIKINDSLFREAFSGGSFQSLMNVVANLMDDETPKEEQIFEIKKK